MIEWMSPRSLVYSGVAGLGIALLSAAVFFHYSGGTDIHVSTWGPSDDFRILNVVFNTWSKYLVLLMFMLVVQLIKLFVKLACWQVIKFNMLDPTKKVVRGLSRSELVFNGVIMKGMELLIELIMFVLACQKFDIIIVGILIGGIASVPLCMYLTKDKTFYPRHDDTTMDCPN